MGYPLRSRPVTQTFSTTSREGRRKQKPKFDFDDHEKSRTVPSMFSETRAKNVSDDIFQIKKKTPLFCHPLPNHYISRVRNFV